MLKLHLGCGTDLKEGFINIDINYPMGLNLNEFAYIEHNLALGLPESIEDDSVGLIYSSHFIEHLKTPEALNIMRDSFRVLKPGGIFRAALPDFPSTFKAYLDKDHSYFNFVPFSAIGVPPEEECWINRLEYSVYQFGEHVSLWDPEKALKYLALAGFKDCMLESWDSSIDGSNPCRQKYSFVVSGVKSVDQNHKTTSQRTAS